MHPAVAFLKTRSKTFSSAVDDSLPLTMPPLLCSNMSISYNVPSTNAGSAGAVTPAPVTPGVSLFFPIILKYRNLVTGDGLNDQ